MSRILKLLFSYSFLLIFSAAAYTQTLVKGTVLDESTQEALFAVNIYSPNTKEGTISKMDGSFEFLSKDTIFQISYIGYEDQTLRVSDQPFEILLKPDTTGLIICYVYESQLIDEYPSTTILDKRSIQINNQTSIAPTLNLTPGVFMHSGAYNTNRITIRGIGNRNLFGTAKIKAYLDDIPLTDGSGETTLEDLDLDIVDQVTVHKGPAGSLYGAGLGGMVRLSTQGILEKPSATRLSFASSFGSYNLSRYNFNISRNVKGKNFIHINASQTNSDGYRDNNEYERTNIAAYARIKLNDNDEVGAILNYVRLFGQIPSSLDSTDYTDSPQKAAFIWDQANGHEFNIKSILGFYYKSQIGKSIYQTTSAFFITRQSDEIRPFNVLRENVITKGYRSEWTFAPIRLPDLLRNSQFVLGTEEFSEDNNYQTYDTDGFGSREDIIADDLEERYYRNFFAQLRLRFNDNILFTSGLNRNRTYFDYKDYFLGNGSNSSAVFFPRTYSPFFNLSLDLEDLFNLKQNLQFSTTVSHGFSPPTSSEARLPEGNLNRNILPERGWNYEVGLQGTFANRLDYKVTAYSMQIKDLIVAQRDGFDRFIGTNAGSTQHNGLELSLNYTQSWKDYIIQPFLSYTYADYTFEEFIEEDIDYSGNELTGTAPHLLNAGVFWSDSKFFGNIVYRFVDAMPLRDDNSIYSDAYQLVDLKLGYKYLFASRWSLEAFVGINNIFNEKYASMLLINAGSFGNNAPRYYYPGLPRNFYAGIKISLD